MSPEPSPEDGRAKDQGQAQQAPVALPQPELWAIPRARRGVTWWPHEPLPSGGRVPYVSLEPQAPLRGMKSTESHVLFVGGPLHRRKLKRYFRTGDPRKGQKVPNLWGQPFVVKPYSGCYLFDHEADRYQWQG